ncbi:MAG: hypothetical protein EOP38_17125 [Rubrivivax sp.]|nr:MAG: hypothetical protein EOP38_17125 [Rubrivivax sp.]
MQLKNEPSPPRAAHLVFRQVALRVDTFDKLKAIQRELEGGSGKALTNAEVIAAAVARWPLKGG